MLELAEQGKYLNYYEIHLANAKDGLKWFFYRVILGRKQEEAPVIVKKKVLEMQCVRAGLPPGASPPLSAFQPNPTLRRYADPADIDRIQEARRLARIRKKELEFNVIMEKNIEAARREIAGVDASKNLAHLYSKKKVGEWTKRDGWESSVDKVHVDEYQAILDAEDRKKGKKVDKKKRKEEPGGIGHRKEGKSRWEFHQVYAERSLGVGLDTDKFLNDHNPGEHLTMQEQKEQDAVNKLAAKLQVSASEAS
jgi:hypothetical protein